MTEEAASQENLIQKWRDDDTVPSLRNLEGVTTKSMGDIGENDCEIQHS